MASVRAMLGAFDMRPLHAFASALVLTAGCSTVEMKPAPVKDAAYTACSDRPEIRCDAAPPGPKACTGDPSSPTDARRLPYDASFPIGCQAFFSTADCSTAGHCDCTAADGSAASWSCTE